MSYELSIISGSLSVQVVEPSTTPVVYAGSIIVYSSPATQFPDVPCNISASVLLDDDPYTYHIGGVSGAAPGLSGNLDWGQSFPKGITNLNQCSVIANGAPVSGWPLRYVTVDDGTSSGIVRTIYTGEFLTPAISGGTQLPDFPINGASGSPITLIGGVDGYFGGLSGTNVPWVDSAHGPPLSNGQQGPPQGITNLNQCRAAADLAVGSGTLVPGLYAMVK